MEYGHWSTLLQRQRAFLLSFLSFSIFIVVALEAGCGVWSMMWQTTRIRGKGGRGGVDGNDDKAEMVVKIKISLLNSNTVVTVLV